MKKLNKVMQYKIKIRGVAKLLRQLKIELFAICAVFNRIIGNYVPILFLSKFDYLYYIVRLSKLLLCSLKSLKYGVRPNF